MSATLRIVFAICGHTDAGRSRSQGYGTAKTTTVQSCCDEKCCNAFIQPLKDAQEKVSTAQNMWKLMSDRGTLNNAPLDVGVQKRVDTKLAQEMSKEVAALNTERARHAWCDSIRRNAWLNN